MAGRGMGAAVRGGGAVGSGPRNKMVSEPSMKTGKVLMMSKGGQASRQAALGLSGLYGGLPNQPKRLSKGGAINQHKEMAMGMMGGGMARGYKKGGMAKKKVKKMRYGGSCG